jgi:cardiolipin synthase (CMP-forming)
LVIAAILDGQHLLALGIFAAAAFTDYLDGAAARHFAVATQAGAYLDPIADKCLLSGVFLALAGARIVPWWLVAVILGRDVYILLGVATVMLLTPIRRFPPSIWGKVSTFIQIATAVVWMARDAFPSPPLQFLSFLSLWLCSAGTLGSGIHYTWRGVQLARGLTGSRARE